ncbi:unnamed protein product [Gongylonema pulchrum]|uniref:MATH domain-containing protein n=1 Tax=Gongylonema pulchrum TaxID=637853 RepID=A0A183DN36_9BILA|nr:unnamed protein product [Gongylonema pulchrum]
MVMPRQHVVQKKGTQKCLGFFLQCCPDAYSDSWSCQAAAELRLISQKQGVPHFTRKTNHVYTAKENDWGYSCFMTWAVSLPVCYLHPLFFLVELSRLTSIGVFFLCLLTRFTSYHEFVKKGMIGKRRLRLHKSESVFRSHEQFEKKIQDYMRLADIQSSRGLIDKAIEVNTSALKFCKDRDQDCKADLEAQKARLIEMKLKQSIERIEKGPTLGKSDEENSLNQSALKQAISGATTIGKQSVLNKSSSRTTPNNKIREPNLDKLSTNVQNRKRAA